MPFALISHQICLSILREKQVPYHFNVNLIAGHLSQKVSRISKHHISWPLYYPSFTNHRVCFSRPGLTIGKYAHVETINKGLNQWLHLWENHVLGVVMREHTVKLEGIFSFVQDGNSVELIFFVLMVLDQILNSWVLSLFWIFKKSQSLFWVCTGRHVVFGELFLNPVQIWSKYWSDSTEDSNVAFDL